MLRKANKPVCVFSFSVFAGIFMNCKMYFIILLVCLGLTCIAMKQKSFFFMVVCHRQESKL